MSQAIKPMRKLFYLFVLINLTLIYSCDDGDITTVELEFDETFEFCGNTNVVFYKTLEAPLQSLSILIENLTLQELLEVGDDNTYKIETTGILNYRSYSNESLPDDLFCSDIPTSEIVITSDYEDSEVTAYIYTILTEDDNDGVSAEIEGYTNDEDGDGIPDYIDIDDDGDNILTEDENPDPNGDGDVSDAQDTDDDGIPDYLDTDDDGDGVLTRDEENDSQDQRPNNDITDSEIGADYLNPAIANTVDATAYRQHSIEQTYQVSLTINDIDLSFLEEETLDFGILSDDSLGSTLSGTRIETPDFN